MEVIEIISNFINKDNNVVEVEFRVIGDSDDMIRVDTIEFEYLNDFGYGVNFMETDIFNDIDEDWDLGFDDDEDFFIDEENLLSFLNEYYLVYEDRLPVAEYR
jgi:translation elongation factor P/translation initiation factor 5A